MTVDDQPRAVPAFIDNLAVVYNKKIFDDAGVAVSDRRLDLGRLPADGGGAQRPRRRDRRLRLARHRRRGHHLADLAAGLAAGRRHRLARTATASASTARAGEAALNVVAQAAADDSVYIDSTAGSERMQQLFASGKMAMNVAGPVLAARVRRRQGRLRRRLDALVQRRAHDDRRPRHLGDLRQRRRPRRRRRSSSWTGSAEPEQQLRWISEAGSLPLTNDVQDANGYADYQKSLPGLDKFIENTDLARTRADDPRVPADLPGDGQGGRLGALRRGRPERGAQPGGRHREPGAQRSRWMTRGCDERRADRTQEDVRPAGPGGQPDRLGVRPPGGRDHRRALDRADRLVAAALVQLRRPDRAGEVGRAVELRRAAQGPGAHATRSSTRSSTRSCSSRSRPPSALFLAMALNRKIRLIGFYRTAFLAPFIASVAAQGVLFSFIFDERFGVANAVLDAFGLPRQGFLGDPDQALFVIVLIGIWGGIGFPLVIYLAALQDVPRELVDAASVDGARRWATLWHVILPQLLAGDDLPRRLADAAVAAALRPRLRDHARRAVRRHGGDRLLRLQPGVRALPRRLRGRGRLRRRGVPDPARRRAAVYNRVRARHA